MGMKGAVAAAYFFALGWYVRASGLDEQLAAVGRDAYDMAVLHTAAVVRRAQLDRPDGVPQMRPGEPG